MNIETYLQDLEHLANAIETVYDDRIAAQLIRRDVASIRQELESGQWIAAIHVSFGENVIYGPENYSLAKLYYDSLNGSEYVRHGYLARLKEEF